jgi:hypothetical protein
MIALTALILMPGFILEILPARLFSPRRVFAIFYIITIMTGVYTVTDNLKQLRIGVIMGLLTLILSVVGTEKLVETSWMYMLNFAISGGFFLFLFIHCVKNIMRTAEVDLKTIYAAICGYLLLGMCAMIVFNYINNVIPHAYSGIVPEDDFFPMLYYSFVTMTTLGYGDISPVHPIPRSLAMFFAIVGQLYLTVLIAMLVGKYISSPNQQSE